MTVQVGKQLPATRDPPPSPPPVPAPPFLAPPPHAEMDTEKLCVVQVREGSEHQALLYLLRSVSRLCGLDDELPDPPQHIADYRFIVRAGPQGNMCTLPNELARHA